MTSTTCNLNTQICRNASQGDQISIAINSVYLHAASSYFLSAVNPQHLYVLLCLS